MEGGREPNVASSPLPPPPQQGEREVRSEKRRAREFSKAVPFKVGRERGKIEGSDAAAAATADAYAHGVFEHPPGCY